MDITMTIAFALIGLAGVAAGGLGIALPGGDRLAAGLALVVGAGVGLVSLAVGWQVVGDSAQDYENLFLVASSLGFLATLGALWLLWRSAAPRARR